MELLKIYTNKIIETALSEDINYLDCAADLLIPDENISEAYWLAKADGVLCGINIAADVFKTINTDIFIEILKKDGDRINNGDILLKLKGKTSALLKGERTALNFVQHMSGISTMTAECVFAVSGTNAVITDTRKTLPGLRPLQKYAVLCGGGHNHRFNLSDAAMLKDNHIDAYGGITAAITELRKKIGHTVKIEIETRTLDELKEAINCKADIIMLDNMDCDTMKKAVVLNAGQAKLEASGNITLENIRAVAETGVDIISLGALTHSVRAFDISMKWK